MPFVKLDTGILDSTLWLSDPEVRIVFITMLAMAGPGGLVEATAPGIARRANLSIETVRAALSELESPDPDSRSLADDGRRVRRIDGGYQITNYEKYRQKDHTRAERQKRYRERQKNNNLESGNAVTGVTRRRDITDADADSDAEGNTSPCGDEGADKPAPPACPHGRIIDLYHEILPMCPRVRKRTENRDRMLTARWRESEKHQALEFWREFFEYVSRCDFLCGRAGNRPRAFSLYWMVKAENFAKIIEGHYE